MAGELSDVLVYDLPKDYDATFAPRVRATTIDGLTTLARSSLLPDHMAIVVVGDRAVIEPGLKALELGPIEYLDASGKPVKAAP